MSHTTAGRTKASSQLDISAMSDFGTPVKTDRGDCSPSQEPARKRQRVRHYPLQMDIVDEPKGDLVIKVGQHEDDVGLVRVHKVRRPLKINKN